MATKKKKTVKSSSFNRPFGPLVYALLFAVVGVIALTVTNAAPPSSGSKATISYTGPTPYIGDKVVFKVAGIPKLSKGDTERLNVYIGCTQNGKVVYGQASQTVNVPAGTATIEAMGGGLSIWLYDGGDANCEVRLAYWDIKGNSHPLAYTTLLSHGYRTSMKINQTNPNLRDKVTFTYSNLPTNVDLSKVQAQFYCDTYPTGGEIRYGLSLAFDASGNPQPVSIVAPTSTWTSTGSTTCHGLLKADNGFGAYLAGHSFNVVF